MARQAAAGSLGRVTVIDLSRRLSPGGTFAGAGDGVEVRAVDGVHMSEPGEEWLTLGSFRSWWSRPLMFTVIAAGL
ncbi:MAG: hypothetical protein ACLP9C_14665 [Acidimicrobiales bacterium]